MKDQEMMIAGLRLQFFVILFCVAFGPVVSFAQTADQYQKIGIVYFQRGEFQKAVGAFSKVIQIDPTNALAYTSRGLVRYRLGDMKGALEDHNQAIRLNPQLPEAYTNRGGVRLAQGDKDGALADHTKSIELDPKNVEAYSNRGLVRLAKGNAAGAIADFDQALKLDPYYPRGARTYTNRATARLQMAGALKGKAAVDELRKAVADSTNALVIDPKLAEAYNIRGLTYMKTVELNQRQALAMGIHKHALEDFTNALRINPRLALAHLNRGILRVKMAQFSEALIDLRKAVQVAPKLQGAASPWIQWAESQLGRSPQKNDG